MARYLKSWESPRSQGRNTKGKGGSARARQLKKQRQTLRNKLNRQNQQSNGKDQSDSFPIFLGRLPNIGADCCIHLNG